LEQLVDAYRQILNKSPSFSVYHLEKVQRFINTIYNSTHTPVFFNDKGEVDEVEEKEYKEKLDSNYYFVDLLKTLLLDLYTYSIKRISYVKVESESSWQSMGAKRK